jgi:hypothetical protein
MPEECQSVTIYIARKIACEDRYFDFTKLNMPAVDLTGGGFGRYGRPREVPPSLDIAEIVNFYRSWCHLKQAGHDALLMGTFTDLYPY